MLKGVGQTCRLAQSPEWVRVRLGRERREVATLGRGERFVSFAGERNRGAAVLWHLAPWDSQRLGVSCARIDRCSIAKVSPDEAVSLLETAFKELCDTASKRDVDNLFFRAPSTDRLALQAAEVAGFRTIGVHLDFWSPSRVAPKLSSSPVSVRPAVSGDVDKISQLCEFLVDDRFRRDGRFDLGRAAELWRASARNAFEEWADRVFVGERAREVVGFLIFVREVKSNDARKDAGRIFLVVVSPAHHSRGVGTALVREALEYAAAAQLPGVRVGTSSSNEAAIASYQAAGFSLESAFCELSWWRYVPD